CSSPSRCLPPLLRPFPTRRSSDLTATVTPTRSCRHSTRRRVVGRETLGLEARSLLFVVGFLLGGTGIAPGPWGIRGVLTTRRHGRHRLPPRFRGLMSTGKTTCGRSCRRRYTSPLVGRKGLSRRKERKGRKRDLPEGRKLQKVCEQGPSQRWPSPLGRVRP